MASSSAGTVEQYLDELPAERRTAIEGVRNVILANLPNGFEEGMQYGMISYYVPLARYPETYNGEALSLVALANQKRYMSLYLNAIYAAPGAEDSFATRWKATGRKLDMGKSCVRFKHLDDVALEVVADAVAGTSVEEFIASYERGRGLA